MSNKFILDLTVRLTEALDQNYDVVNMDTVLAVISALEGATITKEQLETTRLAKQINQLRRRNKSNILAKRAKNLLKKWREMFGITSQAQSEAGGAGTGVSSSVTQQVPPTQQSVSKQVVSSTSQPASPNTNTQLLGEHFDNSLSSIGVDLSRTSTSTITNTTPAAGGGSGSVSNTASANFKFNKKSVTGVGTDAAAAIGSRSNGALGKSTNPNITNNSSPATIINATPAANKVKHPTSFKNLITGINVHNVPKQANPSALSPKVLPPIPAANERKMFIIDDDHNQSQPLSSTAGAPGVAKKTVVGVSSPRTYKSMKRKERNSPVLVTFMDHSSSPIAFENLSHEQTTLTTGAFSAPHHPSTRNQIITSTIDLHDSNSSSNFAGVTEVVSSTTSITGISSKVNGGCNSATAIGISSNSSSNKRIRKDKKRSNERIELVTESEHFQPTIDESSRIAFPISGIQEYLSLSNSSMSIFPAGSGVGGGIGAERFQSAANEDNQLGDSSTERDKPDGDLTFAGKFKLNSSGGIDVESSSSYYKGGGTGVPTVGVEAARIEKNMSVISSGVDGGGNGVAINNIRDLVSTRGDTGTTFLTFSRNSNESSSNSRTSQLDLIDVVNQDSQSMITVDDLRQLHHQKQSSNEKPMPQDIKFPKDVINNASKQQQHQYSSKEHNIKARQLNASISSSKPSTPSSSVLPIVANANVTSPPVVEQKVPKKRGRKKGSKGVDSVLAQSAGLNSQFLMSSALGSNKKVKTTRELLIDIQSRKIGSSATSSPTLMNWFGTSRPASSCSEPSLHSPRTSDANSTNATMSTAARSTPEKNASNNSIAVDELYESDSDTNTSEPSHENIKPHGMMITKSEADGYGSTPTTSAAISSIEEQIKELMAMLPPVDKQKIDWETCEEIPCTCSLREIPPEVLVAVDVKTENTLDLLENVDTIKNEEDDEEPVISVSVLPIAPQQLQVPAAPLRSSRSPTPILPHHYSQSAPVSTVTSPAVPPTTTKMGTNHQILPTKSIFDLDFDDDNDPLHMFVEAASKTKNGIISQHHNRQENYTLNKLKESDNQNEGLKDVEKDHQETNEIKEEHSNVKSQAEQKNRLNKLTTSQQQQQTVAAPLQLPLPTQQQPEPPDQQMMPLFMNFPTYEVIEDPSCEAKQRYEIQTNQITKFHINAFHNCYIPNVNGNWDHSIPENINVAGDDECLKLENDSLYANVVPKYGCLVKERIPKDLSFIKFTSNFKPNLINKKSDKPPPLPFLGVANIHRRQHFHLHHYKNLKKKEAADKVKKSKDAKTKKKQPLLKNTTKEKAKAKAKAKAKEVIEKVEKESQKIDVEFLEDTKNSEVVSQKTSNTFENIAIDTTPPIPMEVDDASVKIESENRETGFRSASSPFMIISDKYSPDGLDQQQYQCPTINNLIIPSPEEENFKSEALPQSKPRLAEDQTQQSPPIVDDGEKMKGLPLMVNGNVPHLMNNNSIIKNDDDNGLTCQKKLLNNNHHIEVKDAEEVAASRRSSSCSNTSLKQNQNSINMKLRQHRMEHSKLLAKQQKRKRKHLAALTTDCCEFDADEEVHVVGEDQPLPPKVPPLIKRIKLVNGNYAAEAKCTANSMTDSSCIDDDNDSDCYHVHSDNDIITEEEDDQQPDDEDDDDDFEEIVDDYDEEDGDGDEDEEEAEEDCGDFHEVVTRDMTSSATGNNHIVLTIKKTPSKTNSPSSSSMSPAPALIQNLNVNVKILPPMVDDVALLIDDDDKNNDNNSSGKLELGKLLELNRVKAVDLITKTDFFLPEATDVAVYNFQLKKNGDKDNGDEETNENDIPILPIEDHDDEEEQQQQNQQEDIAPAVPRPFPAETDPTQAVSKCENPENSEDKNGNGNDEKSKKNHPSVKQEILTKAELAESIQLTKKHFRRIELKKRLREGIEQAQKLHRQLFFPYELRTSSGSKILEINSCTSDCTDPSDDETTDSSESDTELTTSSSSGNGNLKSRAMKIKRRRRTKLPPGKRRTVAGSGNPPSSSSSSSSSSSDSSSSASAFTSWTTSDDDDNADKMLKQSSKVEVKKKENKTKEELEPEEEVEHPEVELPSGNNYLLRSFNHIYVSTEERQRQQQLKEASEYRQHHEVANSGGGGYITLSGDDSKDETVATMPLQEQHNEGYLNYFDVNSRYNVYGSQSASVNMSGLVQSSSSRQQPVSKSSPTTTIEDTSVDVETIEQPSSEIVDVDDEEAEEYKPSTVIMSSVDIDVEVTSRTTEKNSNNRINPDRSVGSININININNMKNNRSVQMNDKIEQIEPTQTEIERASLKTEIEENQNEEVNLVAQEEYRTGIRRVDEDVIDEDGNNCARTQQFKEWHEVLQLRSYNDELLTVLPYVVIE